MEWALSPGVVEAHPRISELLEQVKRVSVRLDSSIRVSGLRLEARKLIRPTYYSGWAYPETRTRDCWGRVRFVHPDGRVVLNIGAECAEEGIIRVAAHEFRHIGQYHRGRKRYGSLTGFPLDRWEMEWDAEAFEERVLERMY